jgi:hypothetical protein
VIADSPATKQAVYRGMSNTFNYGAFTFERAKRSVASDPADMARAFAYFNKFVNLDHLHVDFDATVAAVYKRALVIDPNFEKAKAALKRLP